MARILALVLEGDGRGGISALRERQMEDRTITAENLNCDQMTSYS